MKLTKLLLLSGCGVGLALPRVMAQSIALTTVAAKPLSTMVELPGELTPFLEVVVHAKVAGYVERIVVDRGSVVRQGDLLVELSAPEVGARIAESESKTQSAEADRLQAQAQLTADRSTYERMRKAAETAGAIAGNELTQAEQRVSASEALLHSREEATKAAEAALRSARDLQAYLRISAPFAGVVTERLVHPGAFVGPENQAPLLQLQQVSRLRLVAPVPEQDVGGVVAGAKVAFETPAYPGRTFTGRIARISHSLDQKTRTMAVELDVANAQGALAPGMYATVKWPVRTPEARLFVPKTSVVTTTERTFVIRDRGGTAEWLDVKLGADEGGMVQVLGALKAGDKIVSRATDEIRDGTSLKLSGPTKTGARKMDKTES